MKLGLITLVLSVAALIGLAYNQHLYREAIRKMNDVEKKMSISKNEVGNKQALPYRSNNQISERVSITENPVSSRLQPVEDTTAQKVQQSNPEFYVMFKDALNRYEKEMKEKYSRDSKQYMKGRLDRYKKRLDINDMQWQFVEPILTEYIQKLDQLRTGIFQQSEEDHEDYEDYWQELLQKQQRLKGEYSKKLTPYLTNQQVDDFKNILIQ